MAYRYLRSNASTKLTPRGDSNLGSLDLKSTANQFYIGCVNYKLLNPYNGNLPEPSMAGFMRWLWPGLSGKRGTDFIFRLSPALTRISSRAPVIRSYFIDPEFEPLRSVCTGLRFTDINRLIRYSGIPAFRELLHTCLLSSRLRRWTAVFFVTRMAHQARSLGANTAPADGKLGSKGNRAARSNHSRPHGVSSYCIG